MSKKRQIIMLCLVVCLAISGSILLTACAKSYTVSYNSGNNAAKGTAPNSRSYKSGKTVTVANNTFVLDGYTFNGWSDGTDTYNAGETFTMPARDVSLTALWKKNSALNPDPDDKPTTAELPNKVYDATQWSYMTNNGGASIDGGSMTYALRDGSVKFHNANQAIDLGEKLTKASLFVKATNDFALWFNSGSKDNDTNDSYRLTYGCGKLRLAVSAEPVEDATVVTSTYIKAAWNRIDIEFDESTNEQCPIKLYVNGARAKLTAGSNTTVTVDDNILTHRQLGSWSGTGTWLVAKVWGAENYLQIKPVAAEETPDVPIVAAIDASIDDGASNFYTQSYPAKLQDMLDGDYNVINFGMSGCTVRRGLVSYDSNPLAWSENGSMWAFKQ